MRIFVFKREKLVRLLKLLDGQPPTDLALSALIGANLSSFRRVAAYRFGGTSGRVTQDRYWRRLDDLDDYYQANMDLLELEPPLESLPGRLADTHLPDAAAAGAPRCPDAPCNEGICVNSIISGGLRHRRRRRQSFGARQPCLYRRRRDGRGLDSVSDVKIGESAQLRRCICDRNVHIPPGEQIGFNAQEDSRRFTITPRGVIVIPSDYVFV
jgi:glucose-1-phosphate adenylyltransferase